jgi:hypothetical protein
MIARFSWRRLTARIGVGLALATLLATPPAAEVRFHDVGAGARLKVMTWRDIPFRGVVRQQYDYSCGSAAIATLLAHHYGRQTTEAEAFQAMYRSGDQAKIRKVGFSMLDMKRFAESVGLRADGLRLDVAGLERRGAPAIVLTDLGRYRHFVVVKGVKDGRVLVGDPAQGLKTYTAAEFRKLWNGVAFVLHDKPGQAKPRFNDVAEWRPWAVAPVRQASVSGGVEALTRDLTPLYQVTPVLDLGSVPGGGF